ncbi:hypothetical protein ACFOD0_01640 [Shewanella intestini]|nr:MULTISPECIES: hypothetical protein [Shewanella]
MNKLNISLSYQQLASLIDHGHLCAADLQCLDKETKQALWQMCLIHCQQRIHCKNVVCQPQTKVSDVV